MIKRVNKSETKLKKSKNFAVKVKYVLNNAILNKN